MGITLLCIRSSASSFILILLLLAGLPSPASAYALCARLKLALGASRLRQRRRSPASRHPHLDPRTRCRSTGGKLRSDLALLSHAPGLGTRAWGGRGVRAPCLLV